VPESGLSLWTAGYGSWTNFDSGQSNGTDSSIGGFVSGLDAEVFGSWRVGIAGGYSQSNFDTVSLHSSGLAKTTQLGAYAGGQLGPFALRGGGAWAWSTIETSRDVIFPSFFEHEAADYDADVAQAFGEIAYPLNLNGVAFEPFAGLAVVSATNDSFKEKGGIAALQSSGSTNEVGYSVVGVRAANTFEWYSTAITPHFTAAWQHAFGDVEPHAALAFAITGAGFDVIGVPLAENSFLIETGFDLNISQNATLGFAYSGQFSDSVQDNAVKGNLVWRF
jgi:outer membrane autotransporter protein